MVLQGKREHKYVFKYGSAFMMTALDLIFRVIWASQALLDHLEMQAYQDEKDHLD